jgi:type II secretory pathway pseudopilin PulG
MTARRHATESGESLLELLVTLTIVGLVGVAIIGAVMTSISSSTEHRNLANDDTIIKSAVEQVKYQLQLKPSPLYSDCGSTSTPTASSLLTAWKNGMSGQWPAVPAGIGTYQAWISKVECFTESSSTSSLDANCQASLASPSSPSQTNVVSSGCSSDLSGIAQVTVSVLDQSSLRLDISTLVRNPGYNGNYANL